MNHARVPSLDLKVGEVAPRTVRAPIQFSFEDPTTVEKRQEAAALATPRVFLYDEGYTTAQLARLGAAFAEGRRAVQPPSEGEPEQIPVDEQEQADIFLQELGLPIRRQAVLGLVRANFPVSAEEAIGRWVEVAYSEHMVISSESAFSDATSVDIVPRVGDMPPYRLDDASGVITTRAARELVSAAAVAEQRMEDWAGPAETVALALVKPDLVYDPDRTQTLQQDARDSVVVEPVFVERGETLFLEGQRVTTRQLKMYEELQRQRAEFGLSWDFFAISCFIYLLLVTLFMVTQARFAKGAEGVRDLCTLGALLVFNTILARLLISSGSGIASMIGSNISADAVWYALPVAGSAMLVRALMDVPKTIYFTVAAVLITGMMMDFDAGYVAVFLLTSFVATTAMGGLRERIGVVRVGFLTGLFSAMLTVTIHFVQLFSQTTELSLAAAERPVWSMLFAWGGGILSGFVVVALLPVFETFGYVTNYRLMELASLNHPLMRHLLLRAPGTYHHSVVVGTLAEAACEAIGANGTQAKIAAYFHDIGKADKPQYFVENQRGGKNRHNDLDPTTSARIIIDHVTKGAEMAKEYKLPRPIIDNILMHHGTGLLQYFYAKAQLQAEDPSDVDPSDFRYPGPKPNTREAGVVMLADKVEAATRSIRQPTEENIRAMIHRIINSVMADNQFAYCPVTFEEIHTIAETFVTVLVGIYHQRIEYPDTQSISSGERVSERDVPLVDSSDPQIFQFPTGGPGERWEEEVVDEDTDYESVQNLPHGDT